MSQEILTETPMSSAFHIAAKQFMRYVFVGLVSNAFLFGIYSLLTGYGMGPKLAMSLLYFLGVIQTFVFNKHWTFRFNGSATPALKRYAMAYALGYLINFSALILLVDEMGLSPLWVQGMLIVVIALVLFLAQRYWIFAPARISVRS